MIRMALLPVKGIYTWLISRDAVDNNVAGERDLEHVLGSSIWQEVVWCFLASN